MKKITAILLTLILVCSVAFAAKFSFTSGIGLGGIVESKKSKTYTAFDRVKGFGQSFFASFDYKMSSCGFSVFEDTVFTYDFYPKDTYARKGETPYKLYKYTLGQGIGVGYTFDFGKFSLMIGNGLDLQYFYRRGVKGSYESTRGTTNASSNTIDMLKFGLMGFNARLKGVYHISDNWGISFQFNNSFDFLEFSNQGTAKVPVYSYNGLIGCVFTI